MFYFKEHDKLPQLNLNIGSSSDLADLGALDTGPCCPVLSVSLFFIDFQAKYLLLTLKYIKN